MKKKIYLTIEKNSDESDLIMAWETLEAAAEYHGNGIKVWEAWPVEAGLIDIQVNLDVTNIKKPRK